MGIATILGKGSCNPAAVRFMAQEEIRNRNIRSIIYMAAVAFPVLLVVIGFFHYSLDTSAGVKETWRGGVLSLLFTLLTIFSVSGSIAYILKSITGAPDWLKSFLPRGVYLCLPLVGALIASVDQLVTPSLNAYFIFCVIPSMVILIEPLCAFICFAFGYTALFFALPFYQTDSEVLLSNRANGLAVTALGFCLSIILWRINMVRYQQQRQIIAHKQEIEESYEKLSEAYAANQKFFSIISHDLRGPLSSTVQLSGLLSKDQGNFPEGKKDHLLGLLYERLGNTSKLLDNLLTWARTQTDSMPYQPEELNLSNLVAESTEPLLPMAAEKNILINGQIPDSIWLHADREMVCTVLRNLVANALKFTGDNGRVDINAEYTPTKGEEQPFIRLSVKDSGVGMDKEKISRLFKVGNRVTTLGTRKESGTGLGLILTKEFVEQHGGEITVESKPNEGSTFKVTFPCALAVMA